MLTIHPCVDAIAFCLAELPFTDVGVSSRPLPHTVAMLHAGHPLAFVDFTVYPDVFTHPFGLAVHEEPFISVAVRVNFKPLSES